MIKKWKRPRAKENKMSFCVLYIMMSGGVFVTPACNLENGVVYPDKIVYTDTIPKAYSYVPYHPPAYAPSVVYRDWRPFPNRNRRYRKWRPVRRARRNITINRYYYDSPSKAQKRARKVVVKKRHNKKKFKKK